MWNWIITTFGLKGSWKWACKQMNDGHIVRPSTATGAVKYKLDHEGQGRILWAFVDTPTSQTRWDNANLFLTDFKSTKWVIFE